MALIERSSKSALGLLANTLINLAKLITLFPPTATIKFPPCAFTALAHLAAAARDNSSPRKQSIALNPALTNLFLTLFASTLEASLNTTAIFLIL